MTVRRSDVLVPLHRNAMEVYLLGLCALSGIASIATSPATPGVPTWASHVWYVLVAGAGLVATAGMFWRDALTGLLIEAAAMWPLGAGAYGYAAFVGRADMFAGVVVALFGICAHVRGYQLTRLTRTYR